MGTDLLRPHRFWVLTVHTGPRDVFSTSGTAHCQREGVVGKSDHMVNTSRDPVSTTNTQNLGGFSRPVM